MDADMRQHDDTVNTLITSLPDFHAESLIFNNSILLTSCINVFMKPFHLTIV